MSDERNIFDGPNGDDGKELTAEERRLEALLSEMPRRRCPSHVRENVLAALRRQMEEETKPAEAPKAKVIAFPFRRRVFRILEVAAILVVAAVGLRVYLNVRPRAQIAPTELASRAEPARKAGEVAGAGEKHGLPSRFGRAEEEIGTGRRAEGNEKRPHAKATEDRVSEKAADLAKAATPVPLSAPDATKGLDTYVEVADKAAKEVRELDEKVTPKKALEKGAEVEADLLKQAVADVHRQAVTVTKSQAAPPESESVVASPARPLAGPARSLATRPVPSIAPPVKAEVVPAAQPAAPVRSGPLAASAPAPSVAAPSAPSISAVVPVEAAAEPFTPKAGKAEAEGQVPALVAEDLYFLQGDLDWIEIESSAPVQQQILARNKIDEIRVPVEPTPAQVAQLADRETTWTQFVQTSVASFSELVNSFGGAITHTQEVVVMPGQRRAIVVECNFRDTNGNALINAVNQKRMVAVSNIETQRAKLLLLPAKEAGSAGQVTSRGGVVFQSAPEDARQRQFAPGAPPQLDNLQRARSRGQYQVSVQRMNEEDLAQRRLPAVSNFFAQTLPPSQTELYANQRAAKKSQFFVQQSLEQRRDVAGQRLGYAYTTQTTTNAPAPGGLEVSRWGGYAGTSNEQRGGTATTPGEGATSGRAAVTGTIAGQQAAFPVAETQLYFVLEPDQLPMQVIHSATQVESVAR